MDEVAESDCAAVVIVSAVSHSPHGRRKGVSRRLRNLGLCSNQNQRLWWASITCNPQPVFLPTHPPLCSTAQPQPEQQQQQRRQQRGAARGCASL